MTTSQKVPGECSFYRSCHVRDPHVQIKLKEFHTKMSSYCFKECPTCCESLPSFSTVQKLTECQRCSRDHNETKLFSATNNADPGPIPPQLQGRTQVEEMLISPVMPMMTIYRLPHGQIGYSGHVINLPHVNFVNILPRSPKDMPILVVRKEKSQGNHKDFHVQKQKILHALQWLIVNNPFFKDITLLLMMY